MRFAACIALAVVLAGPARAEEGLPRLRLAVNGPGAGFDGASPLAADALRLDPAWSGGGAGQRPEPALALVLGIIPGFGLGHFYAGARGQATTWLIIDLALLGGSILIWTLAGDPLDTLVWIGWIVERGFEGYFAFRAAGGSRVGAAAPAAAALASLDPRASAFGGPAL